MISAGKSDHRIGAMECMAAECVMSDVPSFGAWLKRRRKALDLTQDALAQLVGCSVVSIRKFDGDEQRPSRQIAEHLAEQLSIPPEECATFIRFARLGLDAAPPALPIPAAAQIPTPTPVSPPPPVSTLPSGTVTFLFTDIVGSTQLWEQHTRAMALALTRHDTILQATVAAPAGVMVKTTGAPR
jgi:transcriptional regulator with XRE-family HTH domain